MPKPFLRKGQGKYTKIDYPVLRRSGVYQPPPDSPTQRQQHLQQQHRQPPQHSRTPPRREMKRDRSPRPYAFSPSCPPERPSAPLTNPPRMAIPSETGVMGQRSPSVSDYSRTSDSPPRTTVFGSSLERRMGDSDEGVVRDMNSPGLPSGRPRTAGTVDSGFPRDELPPLSPASSSGDTRASSIPSMAEDLTHERRDRQGYEGYLPVRTPSHSPAPSAAAAAHEEDEVMVEPAAPAAAAPPPIPSVRRSRQLDHSVIGTTTQEFERREQQAMRGQMRDAPSPLTLHSSNSSDFSTLTNDIQQTARRVLKEVSDDKGEDPFRRVRAPLESAAAARLQPTRPQRMMEVRLDETVASDATVLSPIDNSDGRPRNLVEDHTFRGSDSDSRPGSTSHFRIASSSVESVAAAAAAERRGERLQPRPVQPVQQPPLQPQRRRSQDESSEASSGSTAIARRFLLGERRPLDEVGSGRGGGEITRTQQRPRHQTRASQATMRQQPISIQEEYEPYVDDEEEPTLDFGHVRRREGEGRGAEMRTRASERGGETREWQDTGRAQRNRLIENQLRNAIAHNDMAEAAQRRMLEELQLSFDDRLHALAAAYAAREKKLMEKARENEEECDKLKSELERERRDLRKEEAAKLKDLRTKLEKEQKTREEERKKYDEDKKKNATEISRRNIREEKAKKEFEKVSAEAAKLQTENDRMRRIIESSQRGRAEERGRSAHRAALTRAENEAAAAPKRGGMQRGRFGSMGNLAEKENVFPSGATRAAAATPQGILKKNQVRFADTDETYTVYPSDDTTFTVYPQEEEEFQWEVSRGNGVLGPYISYAESTGGETRVSKPACGCIVFEHANGDLRHIPYPHLGHQSVKFFHHPNTQGGVMTVNFRSERGQIIYYPDGTLEIWRSGNERTKVWVEGGKLHRVETINHTVNRSSTHQSGPMSAEIWENNKMRTAQRGGVLSEFKEMYAMGCRVTHRKSWFGDSSVALHSNNDVEFYEENFYLLYYADTKKGIIVAVNFRKPGQVQYHLYPGEAGEIRHSTNGATNLCIPIGSPRC